MKVLFLTNIPSPYRVDFFNELGKLCDLTVLFEAKGAKSRNADWVADSITDFKAVFLDGVRVGDAEAFCPSVIKYLSKKKYGHIVVGMYSSPTGMLAVEYMRLKKIPFILSTDGGVKKNDKGFKYKMKAHFISAADAWLATGKTAKEYLCRYGAEEEKVYKYPFTSVKNSDILTEPVSAGEKAEIRAKLGMTEEKIVLSVGQFIHRKGYDLLMNTCKGLDKNIGIYIVGGQPTEEYLQLKETLGLTNVHFVDFKKKAELAQYYKAADLFVLPTREDIWGLVVNEAMAYGLPVAATDRCVAGLEMIKDGINGRLVPLAADWGKVITDLLESDNLPKMQANALETARVYSTENMAKAHIEMFEKL